MATIFLSVTEASEFLGITSSLVRRYCRDGRLDAQEVGGFWIISQKALDKFAKAKRIPGNPNFQKKS